MIYIALLRGINVGGNNIIKMTDLKACFEQAGFTNVRTYIQSGNVLFETKSMSIKTLERNIELVLKKTFEYDGVVVVIAARTLAKVVAEAPRGFGDDLAYRYDVLFLKAPLTAKKLFPIIPARKGVDQAHQGSHAVYFARPTKEAGKSQLSKLVSFPEYQNITIRNWNTTTKLLALASA